MQSKMVKRQWRRAFLLLVPITVLAGLLGFACELPTHSQDFDTAAVAADGGITCPRSQTLCVSAGIETCTDLTDDPSNCGGCGVACPATQSCIPGDAGPSCGCGGTTQLCGTACLDLSSNPTHCGGCDKTCGADTICAGGTCVTTCQSGQTNCDDSCTNVSIDTRNCGECEHGCDAGTICSAASCVVNDGGCSAGLTSCSDAGCSDLTSDSKNCGACGNLCGASQACLDAGCECANGTTPCGGVCTVCPAGGACGGTHGTSTTDCVCAQDFTNQSGECCSTGTYFNTAKNECCSGNGTGPFCCMAGMYLCENQPAGQPGICQPTKADCNTIIITQ